MSLHPRYPQAELRHDIYISDINEDGQVEYLKPNKAPYGLKQAGHEWYQTLRQSSRLLAWSSTMKTPMSEPAAEAPSSSARMSMTCQESYLQKRAWTGVCVYREAAENRTNSKNVANPLKILGVALTLLMARSCKNSGNYSWKSSCWEHSKTGNGSTLRCKLKAMVIGRAATLKYPDQ